MSHIATVKTQIKNLRILEKICQDKHLPYQQGKGNKRLFVTNVEGDFSLTLPGWRYPVVVNSKTGELFYDNYGGKWGVIDQLNEVIQEYSLRVIEDQAAELELQGYVLERVKQSNGDVQIVLTQGM